MNKQELIERLEGLKNLFCNKSEYIEIDSVIRLISELDEPETGHADEAPRYVKNILARLRELPVHDREVWLKAIMGEFEQDFSHAKWREGYEQGKFEGAWVGNQLKDADKIRQELNKPVIPQFVAEHIERAKEIGRDLQDAMNSSSIHEEVDQWLYTDNNMEIFARAWLDGYKVEEEKRYWVKLKGAGQCLEKTGSAIHFSTLFKFAFTKKELEDAGFGWVFDCEGIENEEVE